MADVNANIGVNIDTSDALGQLKNLQRQISQFHQSVAKSSASAAVAQRDLQKNFVNSINSIQGFSAELRTVKTTAESFTNSLEKNKFSIREYFRYAGGATKTFGKTFKSEFDTIEKTAIERVKTLQTQYVKMGRDASGAMQAIAIRPTTLNMKDLGTQTAIAAQKQVLFNQLVKQGSTQLLNFGKNTQWAGRQLMVGFTLPLASFGMIASRTFMDMEKQVIKFRKVYGDLFTNPSETEQALDGIMALAEGYTKYGVAVSDVVGLSAEAAAAGFAGADLQNQTEAATRLAILGQIDQAKALETTIALQNAFQLSSADLAETINFLNAVENQTVVSLEDITTAVPRVAPVIQALGGDVKDLAFFLAAMKEGGVNAAQGANALKSGLASLINPSEKAASMLQGLGINIRAIISQNQGDLKSTVVGFATALDQLDPLKRAQAIEQLFGKFQFARISALFDNITREGTQAGRVLDLAGSSIEDLAALSESELGVSAASSMNKFKGAVEDLKLALVPIGQLFLDIVIPFVEFGKNLLDAFNQLPDGMKKAIGTIIAVVGGIGPVLLMTFGLINNGIANMIKFFATVSTGYLKLTGKAKGIGDETQYMTTEQLEAAAAAASLDQAHSNLIQRFTAETTAVQQLKTAYEQAAAAGAKFAMNYPGMMLPGAKLQGYAKGKVVTVGGTGNKDSELALLTPGEAVIPADMAKQYAPLINGMIAGEIPGYAQGRGVGGSVTAGSTSVDLANKASAMAIQAFIDKLLKANAPLEKVEALLSRLAAEAEQASEGVAKLSKRTFESEAVREGLKGKTSVSTSLAHLNVTDPNNINMQTGERKSGSLVRRTLHSQNKELDTGQSSEKFSQDWKSVTGGLNEALEVGGLELTESVREAAQLMDDEIHNAALEIAKGGQVNAEIVEKATNALIEKYKSSNDELGQVATTMQALRDDPKNQVVLPPNKESLLKAGVSQPGERFEDTVKRLEASGAISGTKVGKTTEYTTNPGFESLSTDPRGRFGYEEDGSFKNRPRRPATELGAERSTTYLSKSSATMAASGVSVQAAEISAAGKQLKADAGVASPSRETIEASKGMVEGVTTTLEEGVPEVKAATEKLIAPITDPDGKRDGSSFGNVKAKEPVPAAGNTPRTSSPTAMVQALSQEAASTKTFATDVKSSFANARSNISREMGFVKEEFSSIVQSIKEKFSRGGKETVDAVEKNMTIAEQSNNQLVINGKKAGFNYVAAMQGRDGAVEAVVTRKTAEIVRKSTAAWNNGVRQIPPIVTKEMSKTAKAFQVAGEKMKAIAVDNEIERQKALNAVSAQLPAEGAQGKAFGPQEQSRFGKFASKAGQKFGEVSDKLSNASLAISAVSGVMSMFGGEASKAAGILSMVSGGIFALIQVISALQKLQLVQAVMDRYKAVVTAINTAVTVAATGSMGLFATITSVASAAMMALLGPIGLVVAGLALLAGGFFLWNKIAEDNRQKLEGMGNAAFAAGEKLKTIADIAGFTATRDPGNRFEQASVGVNTNATTQERNTAVDIRQSEAFQAAIADGGELKQDLDNLKKASVAEASTAMRTLFMNLLALAPEGVDQSAIRATVLALAEEAGKGDISVELPLDIDPFADGNAEKVQDFIKQAVAETEAVRDAANAGESNIMGAGALGSALTAGLEQFNTTLNAGKMTATEYDAEIEKMFSSISGFPYGMVSAAAKSMMENYGVPPEVAAGVKDLAAQQAILKALTVGVKPTDEQFKILSDNDTANDLEVINALMAEYATKSDEAANAAAKLAAEQAKQKRETDTSLIREEIDANASKLSQADDLIQMGYDQAEAMAIVNNEKMATVFADALMADSQNKANGIIIQGQTEVEKAKDLYGEWKDSIDGVTAANEAANYGNWKSEIEGQATALSDLEAAGVPTADAIDIISNAAFRSAAVAALGAGNFDEWYEKHKEILALSKTVSSSGSGTPTKSAYQEAIESLKKERKEIKNNQTAYARLRREKFGVAEAARLAADPLLAAALASTKVGSSQWKELIKQLKLTELQAVKTAAGMRDAFEKQRNLANEYLDILEKQINRKYQDPLKAQQKAIDDLQDSMSDLNKEVDSYQDKIDVIQRAIEIDYERPIQALNEESSDLANDLTLMDKAASDITDRYDEQSKALAKVAKINQTIANQQKGQLSLADALASGDIAAAATAMQEMQAQSAAAAATTQQEMLDAAKQAEIDNLRSASGMSREQMDNRQFEISQKIYELEELKEIETAKIRVHEDAIYLIQTQKIAPLQAQLDTAQATLKTTQDALQAEIDGIDAKRQAWEDAESALDKADIKAGKFKGVVKATKDLVKIIADDWNGLKPVQVRELIVNVTYRDVNKPPPVSANVQGRNYGGMIYRAGGGFVPGSGPNKDTVPAMLTPGEFVINRKATKKFGPLLSAINSGSVGKMTAPSYSLSSNRGRDAAGQSLMVVNSSQSQESYAQVDNSVYNYSLSVNVEGSNSSADKIASVVMNKIRNIQSQQVRGQVAR